MANIILALILLTIVGLAARYVYKARKSGKKCIGCPASGCCSKHTLSCGCGECPEE